MWIFSETGFTSTVVHPTNPELLIVRARDAASLSAVCAASNKQIISTPLNDYPFRVSVDRAQLRKVMTEEIGRLNYTNYKAHMAQIRDFYFSNALHHVWASMASIVNEPTGPAAMQDEQET